MDLLHFAAVVGKDDDVSEQLLKRLRDRFSELF
jgi:hypothetical protein